MFQIATDKNQAVPASPPHPFNPSTSEDDCNSSMACLRTIFSSDVPTKDKKHLLDMRHCPDTQLEQPGTAVSPKWCEVGWD